ncbi:putative Ribosomal protein S19e family protein [Hibiscus syriacus]|uniref:Expansin n=1 Tax=Hibiscus syriacus TaxID=106335 RepID=A0A6A3CUX8_HIBSY|nr:putative Ribosomal protein S19e family protein [Hibiscus syriacus]
MAVNNTWGFIFVVKLLSLFLIVGIAGSQSNDEYWRAAHATFYDGACGYGDLIKQGYGLETTATSTALFNDGLTCGACFEIRCFNSRQWCLNATIVVTATNSVLRTTIAIYQAGIVPVIYSRPIRENGRCKFKIKGNQWWILVLVYNVAGSGDVIDVKMKGSSTDWIQMWRNWGQNWQTSANLIVKACRFRWLQATVEWWSPTRRTV